MDIYSKLTEIEMEFDNPITRYSEFTWVEPVMEPFYSTDVSIEELYSLAVDGYRQGMDEPPKHLKKIRALVRIRYLGKDAVHCHDSWSFQIWLLSNKYTQVTQDKMISSGSINIIFFGDNYNILKQFIKDKIRTYINDFDRIRSTVRENTVGRRS